MNKSILKVSLFLALLFVLVGMIVYSDESPLESNLSYYVASDENGIQQVFQLMIDSDQDARQLTYAEHDVITFGVAYDALGIVYISEDHLWLQPIHTEEAESLASVSATRFFSSPIFSQDGNYVAYADNGVWLYDLSNRQTRQILEDVPLTEMASNANEYRIYEPGAFVVGAEGISHLIVDVGIWEWKTAGVYDLISDQFLELDGKLHTSILVLSDGRVLVFGNSAVDGEGSLYIADSLDEINNAKPIVYFHQLTEAVLFAEQAIEIEAGVIRVFGAAITFTPNEPDTHHFYFDFDINTGSAGEVQLVTLANSEESQHTILGEVSSTGNAVPVYLNTLYTDAGTIYGGIKLMNLVTRETIPAAFPNEVGVFHFQP